MKSNSIPVDWKKTIQSTVSGHQKFFMTEKTGKIILSGASGLVGSHLLQSLAGQGLTTLQLVRKTPSGVSQVSWEPRSAAPVANPAALEGADAAIHLSGANLAAHRWTAAYKRELVSSRVESTQALVRLFRQLRQPPRILLCASATGFYGDRGDAVVTEASGQGKGFLADLCAAWDAAANAAREIGMRVVNLRFGAILAPEDGALGKMLPIFRMGLGGKLGSGKQWMNWIALADVVRAVEFLMTQPEDGPFNVVAPNPVTNADFTQTLCKVLRRPAFLTVPAFALRLAFGEIADEALLTSTRALPERLLKAGFHFEFPALEGALRAMLLR
jgi:uncharacterized protein